MIKEPVFKEHFHVEVISPDAVYLLTESGHTVLTGRLFALLAPLLDGCHTVEAIIDRLGDQVTAAEVYYALMHMESKGYTSQANAPLSKEVAAFWNQLGIDAGLAQSRLERLCVACTAFGNVAVAPFASELATFNLQCGDTGQFGVVLTDDYLQEGLAAYSQVALASQRPWLLVKPVGAVIWIGPVFRPGKAGCWECLAHRLRGNRDIEEFLGQATGRTAPFPLPRAALPFTRQAALSLAATETVKAIVLGEESPLEGCMVTVNLLSLETRRHMLVRRPQCTHCGDRQPRRECQPLVLQSVKKTFTGDGGHRICLPEETAERYGHHISPITGIISTLRRTSGTHNPVIHDYVAEYQTIRPSHPGTDLNSLQSFLRRRSGGKGKTDTQARTSALCEALEGYSGFYQGDEFTVKASYAELDSLAIHPHACLLFSDAQYRNREISNAGASPVEWIPRPFDEDWEIDWTPVWSLTNNVVKYVPAAYCYYSYPLPVDYEFCIADSNGNAAGNTREEAILQGLMELVERDSVALWWYSQVKRPAVDLNSFDEPYIHALRAYYRSVGREIWALDITGDMEIPAFVALSHRVDTSPEHIMFGFGAHFDPTIALLRAVTELNQMVSQLPLDLSSWPANTPVEKNMKSWCTSATIEERPYLAPDASQPLRVRQSYPQLWSDDLREDILTGVDILRRHNIEMLVLDQTRPDVGLKVVKVIAPGMRHFWARLAPGRLYDVPVRLEWLPVALREEQLNSTPMFL